MIVVPTPPLTDAATAAPSGEAIAAAPTPFGEVLAQLVLGLPAPAGQPPGTECVAPIAVDGLAPLAEHPVNEDGAGATGEGAARTHDGTTQEAAPVVTDGSEALVAMMSLASSPVPLLATIAPTSSAVGVVDERAASAAREPNVLPPPADAEVITAPSEPTPTPTPTKASPLATDIELEPAPAGAAPATRDGALPSNNAFASVRSEPQPLAEATAPVPVPAGASPTVEPGREPTIPATAPRTFSSAVGAPATPAVAPPTDTAPAPSPAPAATSNAGAPATPVDQLVSVLRPLRTNRDGAYRLDLELRPPELGRVELRVELRDGVLHASLRADNDAAAQLVRDSLGELRVQLAREGVQAGRLSVDDGRSGFPPREQHDVPEHDAREQHPTGPQRAAVPIIDRVETSSLDVRI
jgi:flagellar hook-length control protein FliK